MTALARLIEDGRVHVLDGAMGTMLYSKGIFVNMCFDELNLSQAQLVQEVHEDYVRAGAEVIETNTFGANPVKLSGFGLEEQTEEVNRAAAEIARRAARDRVSVVGAVGPLGIHIEPYGPTSRAEATAYFERQASGLLAGGVDGFILETFGDLEELQAAYRAIRKLSDLPVIAQMSFGEDGKTSYGTSVETVGRALAESEISVIGLNCSVGPAAMLDAVERMAQVTEHPISAQPNAGLPKDVGHRKIYLAGPEYMARYARRMIEGGARFVGGCCGTTPDHIKKIAEYVASVQPRQTTLFVSRGDVSASTGVTATPLSDRSEWGRKIASRDFVTSVELVPPRGWQPNAMLEQCRILKNAGVDAVNVVDGPRAQSRMGVLPSAIIIQREVGIECVVDYTCRDRNMLGMISDLLGAAAAGVRNVLLETGDPPRMGPYDATGVFDIDSIGLTNVVYQLNHGLDPGGGPIGEPTRYVIGVGVNPGAVDFESEMGRFAWKVDAGADFAVTEPVFDLKRFERFLKQTEQHRVPLVVSVWPFVSHRSAEFLANEVPGVVVPQFVLDRMRRAESRGPQFAAAEGVQIAREIVDELRGSIQGVQVSAPNGSTDAALQVLQE